MTTARQYHERCGTSVPVEVPPRRAERAQCRESNYRSGDGKVFLWLACWVRTNRHASPIQDLIDKLPLHGWRVRDCGSNRERAGVCAESCDLVAGRVGGGVRDSAAAAASVAATAAPQPAAAASPASVARRRAPLPPDAHTVISYLSDVINWYGHLGVEAQLVRDPDETLFFADDRQTAGEILKLAFEYARAQAAFIAKTNPSAAAAPRSAAIGRHRGTAAAPRVEQRHAQTPRRSTPPRTRSARASRICRRSLRKRRRASATRSQSQIQDAQSQLDLNQARGDALKALAQFESGSSSPDQNGGLAAQIDELEHSIADSSKKTTTLPADTALVASTRADRDSEPRSPNCSRSATSLTRWSRMPRSRKHWRRALPASASRSSR